MNKNTLIVWLGVVLSIAITTSMDANGYAAFSSFPLLPLFLFFWWWMGFSRKDVGFRVGLAAYRLFRPRHVNWHQSGIHRMAYFRDQSGNRV